MLFLGLEAVVLLSLVAGIFYLVVVSGIIDPGADQPIQPFERWAAKSSIRAYLARNLVPANNPIAATPQNLHDAVDIYTKNCAVCHGNASGKKSNIAVGLNKQANVFATEDWSEDKDELVYWFIEHGVRLTGMPSYKKTLTETEKWKLVTFIKHVTKLPKDVNDYWHSKE